MKRLHHIRTDVVGSLLRPEAWKKARKLLEDGRATPKDFRQIEDEEIARAVRMQESAGLEVVTDGEMRRLNFQDSFGAAVSGYATSGAEVTLRAAEQRIAAGMQRNSSLAPDAGGVGAPVARRSAAVSRLRLERNIPLEEYRFASRLTQKPVAVSLIGPDRVAQRFDWQNSKLIYPTMDEFVDDVVTIQRQIIASLADAGCAYIHIDAPGYTAYLDEASVAAMKMRGEDPAANFSRSLEADAKVIAGFNDVTFGIHLCRGNAFSSWRREGSYDVIAERLFNELPHERFLLEFDTPGTSDFTALRFLPKNAVCVLGMVSTKTPEVETVDALRRRIDEASRHAPLEQLALSPQCGFAPGAAGGRVTEDIQKRKLEVVVETARRVWG